MGAPPRGLAGAAVLLVIVGLGTAITDDGPSAADPPRECRPAVLVDGRLTCGSEAHERVAAECPDAGLVLRDGDALQTAHACAGGVARMDPQMLRALGVVIDVQTASLADLQSLPRVGPVLARRIVEGRPYARPDDLLSVRGIGPATLGRLRPRVSVGVQATAQ